MTNVAAAPVLPQPAGSTLFDVNRRGIISKNAIKPTVIAGRFTTVATDDFTEIPPYFGARSSRPDNRPARKRIEDPRTHKCSVPVEEREGPSSA